MTNDTATPRNIVVTSDKSCVQVKAYEGFAYDFGMRTGDRCVCMCVRETEGGGGFNGGWEYIGNFGMVGQRGRTPRSGVCVCVRYGYVYV